jgi:hypothetical protein
MALSAICVKHGITSPAQLEAVLRAFPHGRGGEAKQHYIELTISKALAKPIPANATSRESPFSELAAVFRRHLDLEDLYPLEVSMAAFVAHRRGGDPVWVMIVGPSSSAKTEIVMSFRNIEQPQTILLSSLTARTLASGYHGEKNYSFLNDIEDAVIIIKDFSSIASLRSDQLGEVLAQFREIYDGQYHKKFGSGVTVDWQGRLTILAAATPAIERTRSINQMLGERFLTCRPVFNTSRRRRTAKKAMQQTGGEKKMRRELANAINGFFSRLPKNTISFDLEPEEEEWLAELADIATIARSAVIRGRYHRDIELVLEPEEPSRFAKQMKSLFLALRELGPEFTTSRCIETVRRVAADSLPRLRFHVLSALVGGLSGESTSRIANAVQHPKSTVTRTLEDLAALHIIAKGKGRRAGRWTIREEHTEALLRLLVPAKTHG